MVKRRTAIIIIDSGFERGMLSRARNNILAVHDVPTNTFVAGNDEVMLDRFGGDVYGNHGTEVLRRVLDRSPESPLVLVRAFGPDRRLVRTGWTQGGQVRRKGWTDAYLQAVDFCDQRGMTSVANCSFGGYIHAMDGTGWESFNLGHATGKGKPGHVVVAGAGPGDGRPTHASLTMWPGETRSIQARQHGGTLYNFWSKDREAQWALTAVLNGRAVFHVNSADVPDNMWNGLKQQTLELHGDGYVELFISVPSGGSGSSSFHCWIEGGGEFRNHVDPVAVAEPACFPSVIAVGLESARYNPRQFMPGEKPDVLLPGGEQVSFRLPEVTVAVARLLERNPQLDVDGVRALLGKMPNLSAM
ncbi:MAG: hypothetical protein K2W95_35775 [Candidatus Obscuribacterales bacterium]|nr:hypothetical protein [Candidatus Obscuribacterales bacterium]